MKPYVSIIIPTYNEKDNIILLIDEIKKICRSHNLSFEIIIIDDNSPDGTFDKLRKIFPKDLSVRIFKRVNKRGLATAILFGIKKAKGTYIIGMDADFNHLPDKITDLVDRLKNCDLVIGSRFIKGGGMEEKMRYFITYLLNIFLKYFLGFPVMDNLSGFYAIKKIKLLKLPISLIYRGYGEYHLRLVYLADKAGLKIIEIPVFYKKRRFGKSKSNLLILFIKYLWVSLSLKFTGV